MHNKIDERILLQFVREIIPLENLDQLANFQSETYCLIAPRALAARLDNRELTKHERDRMQSLKLKAGRDRFLVAHTLKRRILACLLKCESAEIELVFGKYGKPVLNCGSLHFNISYADDWIAVIVAPCGPVGIDLEYPAPKSLYAGISRDNYGYKEIPVDIVMNCADRFQPCPVNPIERFYTCWTLKEAISKVDGLGLNRAFDSIRLQPQADGIYCGDDGAETWQARHFQLADGTHMAHACKMPIDPIHIMIV